MMNKIPDVSFSEDAEKRLLALEQQIMVGYVQMALSLKMIRDEQLFFLRDCDSMKDYCLTYLDMSERQMRRYLLIADTYNEKVLKKLSNQPMRKLIELAKNSEVTDALNSGGADLEGDRVVYSDGTFEPFEDVLTRYQSDLKKKVKESKEVLDAKDEILEGYRDRIEEQEKKIQELMETIQSLITAKDVDPSTVVFITHKKQAASLLDEATALVLDTIGRVDNIPRDLVDAEISGKLAVTISAIEASLQRIRDNWGAMIWLPNNRPQPDDVVPG